MCSKKLSALLIGLLVSPAIALDLRFSADHPDIDNSDFYAYLWIDDVAQDRVILTEPVYEIPDALPGKYVIQFSTLKGGSESEKTAPYAIVIKEKPESPGSIRLDFSNYNGSVEIVQ